MQTDHELLTAFLRGRRSALGELAHRYEVGMLGMAQGLLGGSESLACDAVQETWIRVIRHCAKFNDRSSFKTWVYRILINRCRTLAGVRKPVAGPEVLAGVATDEGEPVRAAANAEQGEALEIAVQNLPAGRRLIILLCYHQGLSHSEAAEILEIPLGTLKSRLHAALKELREQLPSEAES